MTDRHKLDRERFQTRRAAVIVSRGIDRVLNDLLGPARRRPRSSFVPKGWGESNAGYVPPLTPIANLSDYAKKKNRQP